MPVPYKLAGFGSNADTFAQVDPSWDALRISPRPLEVQPDPQGSQGGHYSVSAITGSIAAGTADGSDIFHIRWAPNTVPLMVVKKFSVQVTTLTAFTTLGGAPMQMFLGHGSTNIGSGGTAIGVSGGAQKARSGFPSSNFANGTLNGSEIRIATTGAITAPTGNTNEGQPYAGVAGAPWLQHQSTVMNFVEARDAGEHPVILTSGDCIVVQLKTPGASGVYVCTFNLSWAEVSTY